MSRAPFFFVVAMGAAACQGQGTDNGPGSGRDAPPRVEVAPSASESELQGLVDVSGPEGWTKAAEPGGARWTSPKSDVQLFFGPLHAGEEPRAIIPGLAARWGVSDIRWTEEQNVAIGVDRLPALAADGSCKTAAGDATIAYAAADTGRGSVLVAYVFGAGASPDVREAAMKIVGSFKKK